MTRPNDARLLTRRQTKRRTLTIESIATTEVSRSTLEEERVVAHLSPLQHRWPPGTTSQQIL